LGAAELISRGPIWPSTPPATAAPLESEPMSTSPISRRRFAGQHAGADASAG
jgi:hypothetical protein